MVENYLKLFIRLFEKGMSTVLNINFTKSIDYEQN